MSNRSDPAASEERVGKRPTRREARRGVCGGCASLLWGLVLVVSWLACGAGGQAQEAGAQLVWKNGDVVPGRLLESQAGQVRWSSPLFLDDLTVAETALDSIIFRRPAGPLKRAFRVRTVSGDVFLADLIGSDEDSVLLSTEHFGQVRVRRDRVYSIDRLAHPNLVFDGSQAAVWGVANPEGPIRDLSYRIYDGRQEWPRWSGGEVPDVSRLTPVDEGRFAAGYLDTGLTELTDAFAIVFAGQLEILQTGAYTFRLSAQDAAKLFVDGTLVGISAPSGDAPGTLELGVGFHSLRVEYAKNRPELKPGLDVRWAGPGFSDQPLVGLNPPPGWYEGTGGCLRTDLPKASIFRGMELPDSFEIDLEFTSTGSPRFVLALGGDASNLAVSPQPLRLETWDNELVLVQDRVFESVMMLEDTQHDLRLRLAYDGPGGELRVYDSTARELLTLAGVQARTGRSGLFIRNRGEDLTVRRFRVYRPTARGTQQPVDLARPRVHLMDGRVIYGQFHPAAGRATLVDRDGTRQDIDLGEVDRIVTPEARWAPTTDADALTYADGAIVRGRVVHSDPDRVVMRTGFSETPLACALDGASSLRWAAPAGEGDPAGGDQLLLSSVRLQGRLSFDLDGSPLSWRPDGAARPVRLAHPGGARVERDDSRVAKGPSFDVSQFPHGLHLKNGERIPCQVVAYADGRLGFRSPFIRNREIESVEVKAIAFTSWTRPDPEDRASGEGDGRLDGRGGLEPGVSPDIDPLKLERALTVTRFSRENPPRHILVAKTGDMKRGRLLAISGQMIEFESKLRTMSVPMERIAQVVDVSPPHTDPRPAASAGANPEGRVRAVLSDGSNLAFEALESRDGRLRGRSPIYGDMALPIESIRRLIFGGFGEGELESEFGEWVVHPAREPEFNTPARPKESRPTSEASTGTDPVLGSPVSEVAGDRRPSRDEAPPEGRSRPVVSGRGEGVPDLGLVRVDPVDRSLRFPILINQRSGPVEYALVTDQGKTHESVFRTAAEPTHIHLGLLLLGGKPVYVRRLPIQPLQELPGEPVQIEIGWVEEGVEITKPLAAFVVTTNDAATLAPGPWVYNGSVLTVSGLAAQAGGSIVALYVDPAALINNPRPGRGNDELHRANPEAFPKRPVSLEMILRLARDPKRSSNDPQSRNPNLVNPQSIP